MATMSDGLPPLAVRIGRPVTEVGKLTWIWIKPPVTPLRFDTLEGIRVGGVRRSGKSSLGETISEGYIERSRVKNPDGSPGRFTSNVYDLFSASDSEALGWCNSRHRDNVILIRDPSAIVTGPDWLKTMDFHDIHPESPEFRGDVNPKGGHVFVMPHSLFPDEETRFQALTLLTERFRRRESFTTIDVVLIREASEWLSALMVSSKGGGASPMLARRRFITLQNELFHHGLTVIADYQKETDVLKSLRDQSTFTFYTRIGGLDWARNKYWVGKYISVETIRNLPIGWALCVTDRNGVALVRFEMPEWHFQRRGVSLMEALEIKVFFDESSSIKNGFQGRIVDEKVHRRIVILKGEGLSYEAIGAEVGLPPSTCRYHMMEIHSKGKCNCARGAIEPPEAVP